MGYGATLCRMALVPSQSLVRQVGPIWALCVLSITLLGIVPLAPSARAKSGSDKGTIVGQVESRELNEVSGLVASRVNEDVLWLHNDGPIRRLIAVKTSGETIATLEFAATTRDVEDIAIGPGPEKGKDYLYLGDIGDNDQRRKTVRLLRFPEPVLESSNRQQVRAENVETFELRYPTGAFDAEALLVDPTTGDLFVATKERNRCRVFTVQADKLRPNETITLELVLNLKVGDVSAGDISRDGALILLRSESDGWIWHRDQGQSIAGALAAQVPEECKVRNKAQDRNGEAIGFRPTSDGFYTISEGKRQPIGLFELAKP